MESSNLRKACDACHTSKVRCVVESSSAQQPACGTKCQRCIRLRLPCKFSPPEGHSGPRKRKRTSGAYTFTDDQQDPTHALRYLSSGSLPGEPVAFAWGSDTSFDFVSNLQLDIDGHRSITNPGPMPNDFSPSIFDPSLFPPSNNTDQQYNLSNGHSILSDTTPPATSPSSSQISQHSDSPPSQNVVDLGDDFTLLTNLSCVLQSCLRDTSCPPLLSTIAQAIKTLVAFSDAMFANCIAGRTADEAAEVLARKKVDVDRFTPNTVMLFFSCLCQVLGILNGDVSTQEISSLSPILLEEERKQISRVLVLSQVRTLVKLCKNIEEKTFLTHKHGSGELDGEGGPCFLRLGARTLSQRAQELQESIEKDV